MISTILGLFIFWADVFGANVGYIPWDKIVMAGLCEAAAEILGMLAFFIYDTTKGLNR